MQKLTIIGLGKMGGNMARRLSRQGFELSLFDQNPETSRALAKELGISAAASLAGAIPAGPAPRTVWVMLPAGEITEGVLAQLAEILSPNDTVIDGANSFYKDSVRRARTIFAPKKIHFIDVGVSGGVWGEKNGYALMIGGEKAAVEPLTPLFKALAPSPTEGWLHCGPHGAGHFVKMVHNGIEYGMMQAFAEGLSLLAGKEEFHLDLAAISEMWRHGSVVRSWLLDLIAQFLSTTPDALGQIEPYVADSGEGRWTALEGIELGIPTPVIATSLMARFNSQGKDDFGAKLLAMMRKGFGGHAVKAAQ